MMFTSVDLFLRELSGLKDELFPDGRLETVYARLDKVSLRLVIKAVMFIDIYFNASNGRFDFTLIHNSTRIFGYDNLKSWHYHPHTNSEGHIACDRPSLRQIMSAHTGSDQVNYLKYLRNDDKIALFMALECCF